MSIETNARSIRDEFAFLENWEDRYEHLIDLGKANPELAPQERNETSRVRGCASQVWLVTDIKPSGRLEFRAQSDAMIVSGLIALLIRLFSGETAKSIHEFDAHVFLSEIGISETLTAQRSNGLSAMLARIQNDAQASLENIQAGS